MTRYGQLATASVALTILSILTGCSARGTVPSTNTAQENNTVTVSMQNFVNASSSNHISSSSISKTDASTPNWNNPTLLNGQVMTAGDKDLVVQLPPSSRYSASGKQMTRDIRITQNTLMWTNGKMLPYSKVKHLHHGDYFTAVVKNQNDGIVAEKIYGPTVQIYGQITKISKSDIKAKTMYWKLEKNGSKNLVPTGHSAVIVFNPHTLGNSISNLHSGQRVQAEGFGSVKGQILATDIETLNWRKHKTAN